MNALFIGRFQPFHMGHLTVCTYLSSNNVQLIIGVGSSQYHHSLENPFSFDERREMINRALHDAYISTFHIQAITDIHDPPHWVEHVLGIVPTMDVVVTNNEFTKKLFLRKHIRVIQPPLFDRERFSGHFIRTCIIQHQPWEEFVPAAVAQYLKDIDGVQRIRALASTV